MNDDRQLEEYRKAMLESIIELYQEAVTVTIRAGTHTAAITEAKSLEELIKIGCDIDSFRDYAARTFKRIEIRM